MDIGNLIAALAAGTATATAIYGLSGLSFLDFVTGVFKAFRVPGDGVGGTSFKFTYVGAWAGAKGTKFINIVLVLLVGAAMPDLTIAGITIDPVSGMGLGWAATFAFSLVSSIKQNADPADKTAVPEEAAAGKAG